MFKSDARKFENKIDKILNVIGVGGEKFGRKVKRKSNMLWLLFWFVITIFTFGVCKLIWNIGKGLSKKHYKNLNTDIVENHNPEDFGC